MSFVEGNQIPGILVQSFAHYFQSVIRSDTHVKFALDHFIVQYFVPYFHFGVQIDHFEIGCPLSELLHPIADRRFWSNNQMGFLFADGLLFVEVQNDTYCLDSFAHAHIICQQTIHVILVQRYHPLE